MLDPQPGSRGRPYWQMPAPLRLTDWPSPKQPLLSYQIRLGRRRRVPAAETGHAFIKFKPYVAWFGTLPTGLYWAAAIAIPESTRRLYPAFHNITY